MREVLEKLGWEFIGQNGEYLEFNAYPEDVNTEDTMKSIKNGYIEVVYFVDNETFEEETILVLKVKPEVEDMDMKDIKGYEGLYAVTSCGKVWSYKRKKFLSTWDNGNGYIYVTLFNKGKKKNFRVHRLVAEAYLENPNGYTDINHKDENKKNNTLSNLEWCSHKYNCNYGQRNKKKVYGITMLNDSEYVVCYNSVKEAAEAHGVPASNISACLHHKRPSSGGFCWFFLEEEDEGIIDNAD